MRTIVISAGVQNAAGLTSGPLAGRLLAEMVQERPTSVGLAPLCPATSRNPPWLTRPPCARLG